LSIDEKFLKQRDEVALVWPYKDCVLEGGQDKEDTKRQEIFFNEVLAQDEIDRLLDPKVLSNWTRHTVNGPEKVTDLKEDENGTIKENLLIKGNNLLALHTLKQEFRNKVKLIYIDPPYNTGNDGFKYNDRFNHSTWLTFMKNRLEVARELLRDDGVIFVQCDDNEQAYLKVLMDEVFGRENLITNLIIKTAFENGFKTLGNKPVRVKEFVLYYSKDINDYKYKKVFVENIREWDAHFNLFFDKDKMEVSPLIKKLELEGYLPEGSKLANINLKDKKIRDFIIENAQYICDTKAINLKSSEERKETTLYKLDNKEVYIYKGRMLNSIVSQINKIEGKSTFTLPLSDLWIDIGFNNVQNEGGLNFPNGKKPEALLKRILETSTEQNDIVLDFHAGTGTTGAVAHKMGRQWILVEQMDYIKDLPEARLKKVLEGEQGGISKAVNWQGGGDFIYCELAKYNQTFMDLVQSATSTDELLKISLEMKEKAFLDYRVETTNFDSEEFKNLSIEEQKTLLIEVLDKNQLYVNYTEMEDETYNISQDDKDLTNKFYKNKL